MLSAIPTPVKNCDQLQLVAADTIRDDVGRIRNDEFSRPEYAAESSYLGLPAEKLHALQDSSSYARRVLRTVLSDVVTMGHQVADGPSGPDYLPAAA